MSEINIKIPKARGEFQIRKWKDGELVYDSGTMNNIVVNNFYKMWFDHPVYWWSNGSNSQGLMRYCSVSDDSGEVVAEDTALSGEISTKIMYNQTMPNITIENIEGKDYYKLVRRYLWNQGEFNNVTISKLGILCDRGIGLTDRLVAGQLIKNTLGIPVTITILSDEQLDITYTLYVPVLYDVTTSGAMVINGIEYPYELTVYTSRLSVNNTNNYSGRTLFSSPAQVAASNNVFTINSTSYGITSATKTLYDNRVEVVYNMTVESGPEFNPINNIDYGNLYRNGSVNSYNSDNVRLIRYTFTGGTKPIKLATDTFTSTVKITIQWDEE